jgi:hypothetical protein
VDVPKVEDPEVFERELGEFGIRAIRREIDPGVAETLVLNSRR